MHIHSRLEWRLLLALTICAGCGQHPPKPGGAPSRDKPGQSQDDALVGGQQNSPPYQIDLGAIPTATDTSAADTIAIALCIDVSTSMNSSIGGQRKLDIGKQAIGRTLNLLADYAKAHPNKELHVALIAFGRMPRVVQRMAPFDQARLTSVIQSLPTMPGTNLGDAIVLAAKELAQSPAGSRAIVIMSDGESNSGAAPDAIVRALAQNANRQQVTTADIKTWLIAFDVNARVFDGVKRAGATVVESRDQPTLEKMLHNVVQEVLAEEPSGP